MGERPPISNQISDETGQFDLRFRLWRKFCAERGIPVESLPSTLSPELKQEWERFKETTPQDAPEKK
jgi:hypothetical protein